MKTVHKDLNQVLDDVRLEAAKASEAHGPFNSDHEAYGVLLEELDELWEHVKMKRPMRNREAMYREAVQVAAVAARFARRVAALGVRSLADDDRAGRVDGRHLDGGEALPRKVA